MTKSQTFFSVLHLQLFIELLKYLSHDNINTTLLISPPPFSSIFLMSDKSDTLTVGKGLELNQSDSFKAYETVKKESVAPICPNALCHCHVLKPTP